MKAGNFIYMLVVWGLSLNAHAQSYKSGLKIDEQSYNNFVLKAPISMKGALPEKISYEKYVAKIGDQGNYNTCVAFATTYYMYSVMKAIQLQSTDPESLGRGIFSPAYAYQKSKSITDTNCQEGIFMEAALLTLRNAGAVLYEEMPYPGCGNLLPELDKNALENRIGEAVRLFGTNELAVHKIQLAKKALSEGYPILIGMQLLPSFQKVEKDVWKPVKGEIADKSGPAQALCVIGYDDRKYGGAFRVVNSWGDKWADNGFCWIRYSDFGNYTQQGFQAFPLPVKPLPNVSESPLVMKGAVEFMLNDGKIMQTRADLLISKNTFVTSDTKNQKANQIMAYNMAEPYSSGTSFKLHIKNGLMSYLYVIGSDSTLQMNGLIPSDDKVSSALGPNSVLTFPSETSSITMDNTVGSDFILLLFAKNPLPFNDIIKQMDAAKGTFVERTLKVLDKELIAPADINYDKINPGFELKQNNKGQVVPLLVRIKHI